METLLRSLPNTFIPIFVAIDLFWLLPIFMGITQGMDEKGKKKVVSQSVMTALVVSLIFTVVGEATFSILGIRVDDFKIAGGLVLLVIAILDLTRAERKKRPVTVSDTSGIVPIGVPLIVGPAVMTTIIVLVDHYGIFPTVVALLINLVLVWTSFIGSTRIVKFLGTSAITALSKIMSILLASIAVMMIRLGVEGLLGR